MNEPAAPASLTAPPPPPTTNEARLLRGDKIRLGVSLAGAWVCCPAWPLNWLLIELPCMIYLGWRRRWKLLLVALLCGPYMLMTVQGFISTAVQYSAGTLTMRGRTVAGYDSFGNDNLDPKYRVPTYWLMDGWPFYFWRAAGEDTALAMMYRLQGPMRGTYHGPYPDQTQAIATIKSGGQALTLAELDAGTVTIGGQSVALDNYAWHRFRRHDGRRPVKLRAALYQQQCLLIAAVWDFKGDCSTDIELIDVATGKRFSDYYVPTGALDLAAWPASGPPDVLLPPPPKQGTSENF